MSLHFQSIEAFEPGRPFILAPASGTAKRGHVASQADQAWALQLEELIALGLFTETVSDSARDASSARKGT